MFCMRCGQQVPETASFCADCGQPANQPVAPAAGYGGPPPASAYTAAPSNLRGVSGWLVVFCVGFTILWPIWTLLQYALSGLSILHHFIPLALLGPIRIAFGIVVGIMLWAGKPVALMVLRIYLALTGLLMLWSIVTWVQIIMRFPRYFESPSSISSLLTLALNLVFLVSTIAYFAMSKRVQATYGSKLF
ncbi:MAG TPA: zinc-ribbon domain-containing protein [Candidatus Angelobacter sp.]|nr:zinc-ribbon domain-containing protein [Candidatus Angelobacter sp.]